MAGTLTNAPTPQQVNDAQLLDDMTSLQQLCSSDQYCVAQELGYSGLNSPIQKGDEVLSINQDAIVWTRAGEHLHSKVHFQVLWVLKTPY